MASEKLYTHIMINSPRNKNCEFTGLNKIFDFFFFLYRKITDPNKVLLVLAVWETFFLSYLAILASCFKIVLTKLELHLPN